MRSVTVKVLLKKVTYLLTSVVSWCQKRQQSSWPTVENNDKNFFKSRNAHSQYYKLRKTNTNTNISNLYIQIYKLFLLRPLHYSLTDGALQKSANTCFTAVGRLK